MKDWCSILKDIFSQLILGVLSIKDVLINIIVKFLEMWVVVMWDKVFVNMGGGGFLIGGVMNFFCGCGDVLVGVLCGVGLLVVFVFVIGV